ncbi:hypothetical protein D3C77_177440 [compost metagenome]
MDDTDIFQVAQALCQQAGGHPWYATVQFIEALTAAEQLAHHQRRPALAQGLSTARDRAKLTVAFIHRLYSATATLQILN